jgi:hypothetical protein
MARAAFGTALHGVFFLQPLTVESANLLVECAVFDGSFEVRSGEAEAVETALTGGWDALVSVHCAGSLTARVAEQSADLALARGCSCTVAVYLVALYDGFDATGLHYGPQYRTLADAWGGAGQSLAQLRARATQEGTQVHPADLDDALCVGAAAWDTEGGGGTGGADGETRLPFAIDDARLEGAQRELWAVRVLSPASLSLCSHPNRDVSHPCTSLSRPSDSAALLSMCVIVLLAGHSAEARRRCAHGAAQHPICASSCGLARRLQVTRAACGRAIAAAAAAAAASPLHHRMASHQRVRRIPHQT